jgi:hypothetical protein
MINLQQLIIDCSALENLQNQVTINTTDIGYLKESERENKEKLEIHLAAVLPEETKVKRR